MKALVYRGAGSKAWTEVPDPRLGDSTDVLVRADTTTIHDALKVAISR